MPFVISGPAVAGVGAPQTMYPKAIPTSRPAKNAKILFKFIFSHLLSFSGDLVILFIGFMKGFGETCGSNGPPSLSVIFPVELAMNIFCLQEIKLWRRLAIG